MSTSTRTMPRWDAHIAATSALTDHHDAIGWLHSRIAAALRSFVENERAAEWNPDLQPPGVQMAAWLAHAYGYIATVPTGDLPAGTEMPIVDQWLTDRADRLSDTTQVIASPAAGAAAVAAAHALTQGDLSFLSALIAELPHSCAHLTLSAPIEVGTHPAGETPPEAIHALSWWPDGAGLRIADWISTRDALTSDQAARADAAARAYGTASLPELLLNTEHFQPRTPAPLPTNSAAREGQFSFDTPVADPHSDLAARIVLSLRHLIATGVLRTSIERVRPTGSTGHVTRTPVVVLRTADDDAHTARLAAVGSSMVMRRTWIGSALQWSGPTLQ